MSQADADPSADITPPPTQHPHTDPGCCQDVPAAFAPPSAPLQPPLIPESLDLPQTTTEETTTEETTTKTSEGPTDQPEPAAEDQVVICDQPVSLEPEAEAAEEDVEVCSTWHTVHTITCPILDIWGQYWFWYLIKLDFFSCDHNYINLLALRPF